MGYWIPFRPQNHVMSKPHQFAHILRDFIEAQFFGSVWGGGRPLRRYRQGYS